MLNPINLRICKALLCAAVLLGAPSFAEEMVTPAKLYDFGTGKGEIYSICHRGKEFLLYHAKNPYGHTITNTGMDCEQSSPTPSSKNEAH